MFTNYLKIAWRNLLRDRQFTFLNLLGLGAGLACTLMIYLWIIDEYKIDKYNAKDDQLITVIALGHQAIRTAVANPMKALRTE